MIYQNEIFNKFYYFNSINSIKFINNSWIIEDIIVSELEYTLEKDKLNKINQK